MIENRTVQVLEFDKLLSQLASFAVSEAGHDACLLLRPHATEDDARNACEFFRQGQRWKDHSGFVLSQFPDIREFFSALERPSSVLSMEQLWWLKAVLFQAHELWQSIEDNVSPAGSWEMLCELLAKHPWPTRSWSGLCRCVADNGLLRDESSPELLLVREEIRSIHQSCTKKVKDVTGEYNLSHYLQDEFLTLSSDRYVLPLKSNFKGRLAGIIHDYSQTGETCYFEPMFLVDLNNQLQGLKRQEREEEQKVQLFLSNLLREEMPSLQSVWDLLVRIDVLQAECALAVRYNGIPVNFDSTRPMHLRSARHPLLALQNANALPVDLELHDGQSGLIISGGNAGGKTVCLKTIGLIAMMSMAGLPVPVAAGSTLPCWKRIHAFIGDEQSLEGNVSTFTAQIEHLSRIWDHVGDASLVILDEFGAGTDPAQGAALAQAVVDELLDKNVCICVATHFPALKMYALSNERVRAASVLFDPNTKKPLYRLAYDQVGASQALDVAREHGLPEAVLRRAKHYLLLDGEDSSALIERLNALAVQREKESDALAKERELFHAKKSRLEERFEAERQKLFTTVQGEAQNVLRDWKEQKISHKQALKALSESRERLLANKAESAQAEKSAAHSIDSLQIGETVRYVPWGKAGLIESLDAKKERVKMNINGVSMWVALTDIVRNGQGGSKSATGFGTNLAAKLSKGKSADGEQRVVSSALKKAPSDDSSSAVNAVPSDGITLRVDLRGLRADAALGELEKNLDKALLLGATALDVIHGRGTGALRKEVHNYLKKQPHVADFALADERQGGDGMTKVFLK